jgi:CRISPR-associated protein Cmr5
MLTLDQKRAEHAWQKAREAKEALRNDKKLYKLYVSDAKGLPALIMNSGLMQVMAFLEEKGDRHQLLGKQLRDWLHQQCHTQMGFREFMEELMKADSARFQAITAEAFAWLKWLKLVAAALQEGE